MESLIIIFFEIKLRQYCVYDWLKDTKLSCRWGLIQIAGIISVLIRASWAGYIVTICDLKWALWVCKISDGIWLTLQLPSLSIAPFSESRTVCRERDSDAVLVCEHACSARTPHLTGHFSGFSLYFSCWVLAVTPPPSPNTLPPKYAKILGALCYHSYKRPYSKHHREG